MQCQSRLCAFVCLLSAVLGVPLCKGVPVLLGVEVHEALCSDLLAVGCNTGCGKVMMKWEGE